MKKKKTKEQFILDAISVHGNKYDYSKVEYINNKIKVCIICPKHGEFWQTPNSHLCGTGCPICAGNKKLTTEQFINKCTSIHNNFYDYSKTKYINSFTEVTITCPIHGDFLQVAFYHSIGHGCPLCRNIKISNKVKLTTSEFIDKAVKIHGNLYDYSHVNYTNTEGLVEIICKKHGSFYQQAHVHLRNHGCPKCNMSIGEKIISKFLDENNLKYTSLFVLYSKSFSLKYIIADFYIEHNDNKYIIEYNGILHYFAVNRFGGENKLNKQKIRDSQLYDYCIINNINFIVFDYKQKETEIINNLQLIFKN